MSNGVWAWAWAECLKADPLATWGVVTYGHGAEEKPFMSIGKTAMVHTWVSIKGLRRDCMLPVMDHRNKAIQNPDAFAVNTAIMRCMTKAISMHGLGLYIYAGEDLPEDDDGNAASKAKQPEPRKVAGIPDDVRANPKKEAFDALAPDWKSSSSVPASWAAVSGAKACQGQAPRSLSRIALI